MTLEHEFARTLAELTVSPHGVERRIDFQNKRSRHDPVFIKRVLHALKGNAAVFGFSSVASAHAAN